MNIESITVATLTATKDGIKLTKISTFRKIFISQQIKKANWEPCRRNYGDSNNLHRIKIDPWKGVASDDFISYWPKDSIDSAKQIGIKITKISTCRKIFISQQIWKQIVCIVLYVYWRHTKQNEYVTTHETNSLFCRANMLTKLNNLDDLNNWSTEQPLSK